MDHQVLADLKPQKVFHFFEELCQIPHESYQTAAASDWAEAFAKDRNLTYRRDKAGNIIIWKEATPGYEDHPTVMIQGHLDMVCVKDNGVEHDFRSDPLDLYIEDGFIKARGTSLGGDNGIAVAMAMAVLDDDSIPHPPLECLFTVDEEVGLEGANALDCSDLKSKYLLNLDSEVEGVLTVGCAGGMRCEIKLPLNTESVQGTLITLNLEHLNGGHSGIAIHQGFANANKLMGECLTALDFPQLVSLSGGQQNNAIPSQCKAVIVVESDRADTVMAAAKAWFKTVRPQCPNDPDMTLTVTACAGADTALTPSSSKEAVEMIHAVPNGVQSMNPHLPGQVQTSLNLGILQLTQGCVYLDFMIRSSLLSELCDVSEQLLRIAINRGAAFITGSCYLPWEYRPDSALRDTVVAVFQQQYGTAPLVETIHAGLECGLLIKKMPQMEAISFGPDILEVHSTKERLSIASTQQVWKFLLSVLKAL